jgi:hypothetical protein
METTNDPLKVFEQYEEGVEIHEDKRITISPNVQRDILNATAGLMHEQRKLYMILVLVQNMLEAREDGDDTIAKVQSLIGAFFEDPDAVSFYEADSMEEVKEILGALDMPTIDEEEVKN